MTAPPPTPIPAATGPAFRCARESQLRNEPIAGTASIVRAFLLVEFRGAWGEVALRDARLPDGVGARLQQAAASSRVRILLARRHDRSTVDGVRVVAATCHPRHPRLEAGELDSYDDVLALDLAGLRAGTGAGLPAAEGPVFGVCTHGRHDACCAERGRPAVAALARAHPEHTWEVSHLGGDRFAANLLVLPEGLYYGRVDRRSALEIAGRHVAGELDLDHLRGRSSLLMAAQAAEIALRRRLDATRLDAVMPLGATRAGAETVARFGVGGEQWAVRVRTTPGEPRLLTCGAERENPPPVHEVLDVAVAPPA